MVVTTIKGTNITEERMLAILTVCCIFWLLSLCYLPHAGYGGGTTTRWMVVATMGQEDNIAEESTLAILPVCCFGVFNLFVISHMLAMAEG